MGHPAPTGVNVGDYFRFSCNPELGTEHGALHWQCVFAVKVLPYGWRDPAKRRPEYVEIDVVRCDRFGHLGFCHVRPIRTGALDAFGRLGWDWPKEWRSDPQNPGRQVLLEPADCFQDWSLR